jgi:hypothetical protein
MPSPNWPVPDKSRLRSISKFTESALAYVAVLAVTTDYWATMRTVPAVFQALGSGFEFWRVNYPVEAKSASVPRGRGVRAG